MATETKRWIIIVLLLCIFLGTFAKTGGMMVTQIILDFKYFPAEPPQAYSPWLIGLYLLCCLLSCGFCIYAVFWKKKKVAA
jgi:formate hydrogenlyase subunit 3/multisubunit Na+/H+ antiporter MnhD subunit